MRSIHITNMKIYLVDDDGNETEINPDDVVSIEDKSKNEVEMKLENNMEFTIKVTDSDIEKLIEKMWWPYLPNTPFSRS